LLAAFRAERERRRLHVESAARSLEAADCRASKLSARHECLQTAPHTQRLNERSVDVATPNPR
jgi:hypothetical protein